MHMKKPGARRRLKAQTIVNRHIYVTCSIRHVQLVTETDTLFMSRPGLCKPPGVDLCI